MESILKALGLTIWGLIAIGLMAIFIFVGYEASIRFRASSGALVNESTTNDQSKHGPPDSAGDTASSAATHDLPRGSVPSRTPEATRKLLLDAAHNSQYESTIAYGMQLADGNSASPGDLSIVAQSYSSVGDCGNARLWGSRAQDAFQAAGMMPDDSLRRVISCCAPGRVKPPIALGSVELARIDQLLDKTDAAKSDTGGPFVRLGQLYYGFGDYELAIASIQRGLKKGKIEHLDEAYVYLGLSEQAVGDLEAARNAFGRLRDVPGISPRVLRLWTLYAETRLTKSENADCSKLG